MGVSAGIRMTIWLTKIFPRIKSRIKISTEAATIAWVVARPTPCVPPVVRKP